MKTPSILTVSCIVLSCLLVPAAAQAGYITNAPKYLGLERGLVGFWSFDGKDIAGVHAYDKSGNGNRGVLTSGPVRASGKLGQALQFDGVNDYVDMLSPALLDNSAVKTISAWIKLDSFGSSGFATIASKEIDASALNDGWALYIEGGSNNRLAYNHAFTTVHGLWATPANSLTTNRWYHIVMVYDRTSTANDAVFYIDGTKPTVTELATPNGATENDSANGLVVGAYGDGTSGAPAITDFFDGLIDDVRLYDRALSADEIKRLYKIGGTARINTAISGPTNGLVGYWTFDGKDIAGVHAYDASGTGNRGVLTSGPARVPGKLGQALQFDGVNDIVQVADNAVFDLTTTNSYTWSVWTKPSSLANGFQAVWCQCVNGDAIQYFLIYAHTTSDGDFGPVTNGITAGWGIGNGTPLLILHSTDNVLSTNTWAHIVVTYNGSIATQGSRISIYVNGVEVTDRTDVTSAGALTNLSPDDISIGSNWAGEEFPGTIDDMRYYNRLLTKDEIKRLYKIGGTARINTAISGPTNGLVGHWTFDGKDIAGVHAYDASGQGNRGVLTSGPVRVAGKLGQALNFDGVNDYVNAQSETSLDNIDVKTISAWVKLDSFGSGGFGTIIAKDSVNAGTLDTWALYVEGGGNNRLVFEQRFDGTPTAYRAATSNSSLSTGLWYHIVVVYDRTSNANDATVYMNNVKMALTELSSPNGSALTDATSNMYIGSFDATASDFFDGLLDDVRIYNRALSADEIKRLYNAGR